MENNYDGELKNEEEGNEEDFQDELNRNNKDYINQEEDENDQAEETEEDDDRLTYTLITLDLGNLIHIFEDNNISFVDMLLLSKEDLVELQLEIFQRNRILNFSGLFAKYAKNYSIREISDFFTFNKQFIFNSTIYDKVITNNMNAYQNDMNNTNYNMDNNNNYGQLNQEMNFINSNQEFNEKQNTNNYLSQSMQNNPNNTNIKLNNQPVFPKIKESQIKNQNINGGLKKSKNISAKNTNTINNNNNNNNDVNPDNNFHNKLLEFIRKRKGPKFQKNSQNISKGNNIKKNMNMKNQNELEKNEEYQKIIEKIGILENNELNYELYTRLNLIKNYINNKRDKISMEDIISINNDVDSMIETMNMNINLNNKNDMGLNNNEGIKKNRIKVVKKQ